MNNCGEKKRKTPMESVPSSHGRHGQDQRVENKYMLKYSTLKLCVPGNQTEIINQLLQIFPKKEN